MTIKEMRNQIEKEVKENQMRNEKLLLLKEVEKIVKNIIKSDLASRQ